jgi:cytosine/adenosine deaminase-related metal-dependent hydrolase
MTSAMARIPIGLAVGALSMTSVSDQALQATITKWQDGTGHVARPEERSPRYTGRIRRERLLRCLAGTALQGVLALGITGPAAAQDFDLVIVKGRVVDPESGLDAVRSIGIRDGKIAAISDGVLAGRRVVDAGGLVVAPGFIDLHAHGQTEETYRHQALDGVTTSFELEVGTADIDRWYREREKGRLINHGVSIGQIQVRMAVLRDPGTFLPIGDGAHKVASPADIAEIAMRIDEGLRKGAVGVGLGPSYTPAATPWEILEMFRVAGRHRAPVHVHIRGGMSGLEEVITGALISGAPLHVVHINSSSLSQTREMLQIIAEAQSRGLDITTEAYPYAAGMTEIQSANYDGWEKWPDERFGTIEWPVTGERLTRETFRKYRTMGGPVIGHSNTDEMVAVAINSPLTAIASDGYMSNGIGHPRTSGTYSKVLGRYVREAGSLSLMDALRKMTLMPARRLEARVPVMAGKGRIRVGADADVTIFDMSRVADRSTYREPTLPPEGIRHVVVGGVSVVSEGKLVPGVSPGRAVRAPH